MRERMLPLGISINPWTGSLMILESFRLFSKDNVFCGTKLINKSSTLRYRFLKINIHSLFGALILFFLFLICHPLSAQKLEVREFYTENYPEVTLIISGNSDDRMKVDEKTLEIKENGIEGKLQYIRHGYPLAFGLRIFSSPKFVSRSLGDSTIGDLLISQLNSTFADIEYFFRKDIPQQSLYDALQLNLEKMGRRKRKKRWFTLLLLDEGDSGSDTPFETILSTVDFMNSPIFVLFKGNESNKELLALTEKSDGAFHLFNDPEELLEKLQELNRLWRWGTEIRYRSPERSRTEEREVKLSFENNEGKAQFLTESYKHKSDLTSAVDWNNWPAMLAAVLLSIGSVVLFFYWRSRRAEANHIYPAITYVAPQVKKGKLKLKFNSPNKNMSSRVTISTLSGKPVMDFHFSGTRRRAKVQVGDLPEGIYTCMLSNAGLNSEKIEFRIM